MSSRTSSNSNPSFPMNFLKFKQIVPNKQKKCKQNQNAKKKRTFRTDAFKPSSTTNR